MHWDNHTNATASADHNCSVPVERLGSTRYWAQPVWRAAPVRTIMLAAAAPVPDDGAVSLFNAVLQQVSIAVALHSMPDTRVRGYLGTLLAKLQGVEDAALVCIAWHA